MPSKRISAFIADKKLRELGLARQRLLAAYDDIVSEAGSAPDRLMLLATRLAELRHGNRAVHPEVVNLELMLADNSADRERWEQRLLAVIRQGRARAELLPVYGGALSEWLAPARRKHAPDESERAVQDALWNIRSPEPSLWSLVETRLDDDRALRARAETAKRAVGMLDPLNDAISLHAMPDLEMLTPAARIDARSMPGLVNSARIDSGTLEFQASMRLLWNEIDTWDWPEQGARFEPFWSGQRFRLRPKMDFVTACVVEAVGEGLAMVLVPWSGAAQLSALLTLQEAIDNKLPESALSEVKDAIAAGDPFGVVGTADVGAPGTLRRARTTALPREGEYASAGRMDTLLAMLCGEIEIARSAGRQLHVFATDLADFYPSVSHELVEQLLSGMGVDARVVSLVRRVLSVRTRDGQRTTRGLPLGMSLSRVLGQLVIEVLVSEVRAASPVDIYVLVDEIVLVAKDMDALAAAKEALFRAISAAGLAINPTKTGQFSYGAPQTEQTEPVRFGLLELTEEGFVLHEEGFRDFLAMTAAHIEGHEALLDQVSAWKKQLRWLFHRLAPAHALTITPSAHLATVRRALEAAAELTLTAPDGSVHRGITALLRYELGRRWLSGARADVSDAVLRWPISAGGLGLYHPIADLVPLELAARNQDLVAPKTPCVSDDDLAWGAWFVARLAPLAPVSPKPSPTLDSLVSGFKERGNRLGPMRGDLSPYWRWVLTTCGPEILDIYGSFDFVSTDLVPISLIRESLGGKPPAAAAPSDDDIPF